MPDNMHGMLSAQNIYMQKKTCLNLQLPAYNCYCGEWRKGGGVEAILASSIALSFSDMPMRVT